MSKINVYITNNDKKLQYSTELMAILIQRHNNIWRHKENDNN